MIAVLRSEVHRSLTVRSGWISMAAIVLLGLTFGWFSVDFWSLLAELGAFAIAVMNTGQHYQHRTAVLLYLGQPRRLTALAAQALAAVVLATAVAVASGLAVLVTGAAHQFRSTLAVVPLMALYGVFNATVVRRPTWLFIGYAGWFIFIEGLVGKLELPLPISSFLKAGGGDYHSLLIFAGWTALAMVAAIVAVHRDLTSD
ncbi:hypothetical protein GCM10023322_05760 [Rugosimonospora acidiphila]|uniref:ABC-2 type transport system permease protein n=1 Tax=Rugosimonospora acidiphila TaxID=556531 RepID=A0ABP9RJK5_9ACTN